jgi:methylornithine synthase
MNTTKYRHNLAGILENARRGKSPDRKEIEYILRLRQTGDIEAVFKAARDLRRKHFDDRIFLYGFIYFSTHCRNNCSFCYYRRTNTLHRRYRQSSSEILDAARRLADSGVHLIDLTLGEDPQIFNHEERGFDRLIELVRAVRAETGLPVMVSPGVVPPDVLPGLAAAGACWFACYQETHNPALFKTLRPGQSYTDRLRAKRQARNLGLLIEEGILCGVGESDADVAESIEMMGYLDASQIRVMSFVPQKGTPMQDIKAPDPLRELMIIAILRLVFPDRLVPATLDVAGLAGLKSRLAAGANVVTSLVPPGFGLAGVAQSSLDISESRRTAGSIIHELEKFGLRAASSEDYTQWVQHRRSKMLPDISGEKIAC